MTRRANLDRPVRRITLGDMMHSFGRHVAPFRLLLACLTLAAVIAGCEDPTAPLPREGPPDELYFAYGGFGMTGVTIRADGMTVAMWRRDWDAGPGTPIDTLRVVPTADAWRQFWAVADQAGVHHWKSRYAEEDIVDGAGWTLRLAGGGFSLASSGSNAYPDWFGRKHGGVTPEFEALMTALGNLIGEPL